MAMAGWPDSIVGERSGVTCWRGESKQQVTWRGKGKQLRVGPTRVPTVVANITGATFEQQSIAAPDPLAVVVIVRMALRLSLMSHSKRVSCIGIPHTRTRKS
mmetsp:Transcript_25323/g.58328  ORF Transcript_25323/g.58328 Transcript_25323/m.58328 type:complete len:102 (-) Transcript_25323:1144-1449(-)